MDKLRRLTTLLPLLFTLSLNAQSNPPFYWYHGKRVFLNRADNLVAAEVLTGVNYSAKFPSISKLFTNVASSNIGSEVMLLQAPNTSSKAAMDALAPGIGSHQVYQLDHF